MKPLNLVFATLLMLTPAFAEPLAPLPLWPDGVPDEPNPLAEAEKVEVKPHGDHQIDIMSHVSVPQLTIYPAKNGNGTAVIICPGGGYNILAYSHEGTEVAEWLNSMGITAGLLKYRVPRRDGLEKHHAPLQDAHRAIEMMRERAEELKLKPDSIGILGFSAGGHLAAMALTHEAAPTYAPADAPHTGLHRPNFGILVYPAYLQDENHPDQLSPELTVTENTPPAFLVVSHGDTRFVESSAVFYLAMKRKERSAELHIFARGNHGFGLKNTDEEIRQWPTLAENWMRTMQLIPAKEQR